jgi:hypothetical protein
MKRVIAMGLAFLIGACSKQEAPSAKAAGIAADSTPIQSGSSCAATGLWSECQVLYHLERAGVAPKVDSSAKPAEKLKGRATVMKIGSSALLEVYIYPDSASRIADEKTLDRTQFLMDSMPLTFDRKRVVIESVNLLGLFTTVNARQRERVSDAITAGPPQAEKK